MTPTLSDSGTTALIPSRRTRWASRLFGGLETLSALRQRWLRNEPPDGRIANPPVPASHQGGSVWVFVSTIGELNLGAPMLDQLNRVFPGTPLTLLTDRPIYRDSYLSRYPGAHVHYLRASRATRDVDSLMRATRPRALLIVEIPCILSDAPCRLPYAVVHTLRCAGIPIALLNGWLYGYSPASTLDRLERRWFGGDYLRSMSLITVQTEEIRQRLIAAGARPAVTHTTGNTKFDAVDWNANWSPEGKRSAVLLSQLRECGRPIVVAGCVTDDPDQDLVVSAFARLLSTFPDALLILAPRHPEKAEVMETLWRRLGDKDLRSTSHKQHGNLPLGENTHVHVLDTFGELRDFYAIGSTCFVGRDHNLLEPLAYRKPVTTTAGWEPTYPSYPVYRQLIDLDAVATATDVESLARTWADHLSPGTGPGRSRGAQIGRALATLTGATERNLALLEKI